VLTDTAVYVVKVVMSLLLLVSVLRVLLSVGSVLVTIIFALFLCVKNVCSLCICLCVWC